MKLQIIAENSKTITLYKGVSEHSGLANWPEHNIGSSGSALPGFLSSWKISRTYSQPTLTGPPEQNGMIAEFQIDTSLIDDRTEQFIKWCDQNNNPGYDISVKYPPEWRTDKSIWTICNSGSGHAGVSCFGKSSFVYCGVPLPYVVVAFYNNQQEWDQQT